MWVTCFVLAGMLQGLGSLAIAVAEYRPPMVSYQYNSRSPALSSLCGNVSLARNVESNSQLLFQVDPAGASEYLGDSDRRKRTRGWLNRARIVCSELLSP